MSKKILVTGGAGYVGSVLIPKLLAKNYEVIVYDLMIYGDEGLPKGNSHLKIVKADIRDIDTFTKTLAGVDTVLHMACISNDPSFELDPALSRSVNFECFEPMVIAAKKAGVKRFIYVSSSSVYGVSDAPEVTETHPLVPLTDYNKYKGLCEPLLFKHQSPDFTCLTIRPATVCGYSPRMRLDLSVNILTNLAVNKGTITVFGGAQKRPNVHVDDLADLYVDLMEIPAKDIQGEIFNYGHQNHTIAEMALMVKKVVETEFPEKGPIKIETTVSNDLRSYHVSSKKILAKLGKAPRRSVEDAVRDLCRAIKTGKLPNSLTDKKYFNVQQMKEVSFR